MNIHLGDYWRLLATYLRPHWPRALALAALLGAAIGLELLGPQILRHFLDIAQTRGALATLLGTAVLFIAVSLAAQSVRVVETYVAENLGWLATNALRADLVLHLLRLDISFHKAHTPGELIERIDGDVTALANVFSRFVIYVLGNLILLGGIVALLWREDWRVGLTTALFAALILAVMMRLYELARPMWSALDESGALFFGALGEWLAATEDIRACGAVPYVVRRFYERVRAMLPLQLKAALMGQLVWVAALNIASLATAIALALGVYLHDRHAISVGTIYLIYQYVDFLVRPISHLQAQIQDLQQAGAAIGRVEALFAIRSALDSGAGAALPDGALMVECDGVSFGYSDGEPVLRDVAFRLEPGRVLGLLGRTGSGKTTLARLLMRLIDPTEGTVRLGGIDTRTANLDNVRRRIGMVTQDVQLFDASVRDNLTFFDASISDTRLLEIIDDLGLDAWYRALPQGLDTPLAAGGRGLSAGEAQLLAFVRVFLKDAGLVILDEASSRLDPATERLIDRAMERLLRGRSGVIIAHRLSTVARVDDVVILDGGRIAEYGSRVSLAGDRGSLFYQLLQQALKGVLV